MQIVIPFLGNYIWAWMVFMFSLWKKLDYINDYIKTSIFFFLCTIVIIPFYYKLLYPLLVPVAVVPLVSLVVLYAFIYYFYAWGRKFFHVPPIKKFQKQSTLAPYFDNHFIISKSFEILFQDTLIVVGVLLLHQIGVSIISMIVLFIFLSFFTHIFLLVFVKENPFSGWYLTLSSTATTVILPYLILSVHYGFIYFYILHWVVGYLFLGVLANVLKKFNSQERRVNNY